MRRRLAYAPESFCCRCRLLPGVVIAVLMGALAAACNTVTQPTAGFSSPRGATIAFESIDGAPRPVFHKLVQNLSEEAAARAVPVVSRHGSAAYRVRGYLAAQMAGGRTTYAWVWDVYDRDQNRALRISGKRTVDAAGGNAWSAADDQMVRGIARASMDRVATFLGATGSAPVATPTTVQQQTYAVASAPARDDFSPEAWGIFRIFGSGNASARAAGPPDTATQPAADVPLPRQRPRTAGKRPDRMLAYAGAQR